MAHDDHNQPGPSTSKTVANNVTTLRNNSGGPNPNPIDRRRKYSDEVIKAAIQLMLGAGFNSREVASMIGPQVSVSTPYMWLRRHLRLKRLAILNRFIDTKYPGQFRSIRPKLQKTRVKNRAPNSNSKPRAIAIARGPRIRYPQAIKEHYVRLYDKGRHTFRQIAKMIGPNVSPGTVVKWRQTFRLQAVIVKKLKELKRLGRDILDQK